MLVNLVCWLLKRKQLSQKNKQKLFSLILEKVDALPTHSIITVSEDKIFIRGVPLQGEQLYALRDAAETALHNKALEAVHEQVLYSAISIGVHQAQTSEQIQFAKAAIWYGQEELRILRELAQMNHANSSLNGE